MYILCNEFAYLLHQLWSWLLGRDQMKKWSDVSNAGMYNVTARADNRAADFMSAALVMVRE